MDIDHSQKGIALFIGILSESAFKLGSVFELF
jgi:hypothetical protein